MLKNKYAAFGLFVILFLVLWNVLDFLYATLITKSAYQFGAGADLAMPLAVALAIGYLQFLRKGKSK